MGETGLPPVPVPVEQWKRSVLPTIVGPAIPVPIVFRHRQLPRIPEETDERVVLRGFTQMSPDFLEWCVLGYPGPVSILCWQFISANCGVEFTQMLFDCTGSGLRNSN